MAGWMAKPLGLRFRPPRFTYHFVVYLVEMNFANFVYHIFALKCNEAKTCKRKEPK